MPAISPIPPDTDSDSRIYPAVIVIGNGVDALTPTKVRPRAATQNAPHRGEQRGLNQELNQYLFAPGADRLAKADLESPLRHADEHDVHDHNAADE